MQVIPQLRDRWNGMAKALAERAHGLPAHARRSAALCVGASPSETKTATSMRGSPFRIVN
jgi:hypothetical protein